MAFLRILLGGREYRRELGDSLIIGRDAACDLRVDDPHISRAHCLIERCGAEYVAVDLDSHNGTLIGGWPLTRQVLKHGDLVKLGPASLQFLLNENVPIENEVARLLNHETPAAASTVACPVPDAPASSASRYLSLRRRRSLWERAMRSAADSQGTKKRKRKRIKPEKLRNRLKTLRPQRSTNDAKTGVVQWPWYYRPIPLSLAIPASLGLLIIVYLLANGIPGLSGSSSTAVPASLPHSSPHNND